MNKSDFVFNYSNNFKNNNNSGYSSLAQKEYKKRHDKVVKGPLGVKYQFNVTFNVERNDTSTSLCQ